MANKLAILADIEGYSDPFTMLEVATFDSVSPGICTNGDCEYTCEVEPDQDRGFCESCERKTVKSALVLAGMA